MNDYISRLHDAIRLKRTPVCVGLDPRQNQLPESLLARKGQPSSSPGEVAQAYSEFCRRIIDIVAPLVPVVKPQAAFFEELGPPGVAALAEVMQYARNSGVLVVCDAKRGDIGSTAEAYARGYLAGADQDAAAWPADALTVNPYLGADTLEPFIRVSRERGAGIYVLVRTSNPGAGDFQDRAADGRPLYECVGETVERLAEQMAEGREWGSVGAVVGATYPEELVQLRQLMPHTPFLVPGYGSQGGAAADVAGAFGNDGLGAIINSSRGIIFAYRQEPYSSRYGEKDWERAVEEATREMIGDLAANTPAANL